MKKIKFKTLSIQNFLSIGNDAVVIDFQNGLNLITGTNIDNPERKNGTGKSAIIEGFYYALFGTTIRDIKKEFVVNNVTKGAGKIELLFDVQSDTGTKSYKIVRTLKPSSVELYQLGLDEPDISKDSIANTNKYINELIGSNPVICKSCDILSMSDNIPFMAKKPEDKRKFIEDIFALEIFGKMLKDLKEMIKDNKGEVTLTNATLNEISNSLENLVKLSDEQKKEIAEREELIKIKKKELEDKITLLQGQYDALKSIPIDHIQEENDKLDKAWTSIDGKLSTLIFKISEETALLKIKNSELSKADGVDGASCDKCLQSIPESHIEHIKHIKDDLGVEITRIKGVLVSLNNDKDGWNTKKSRLQAKIASNTETLKASKKIEDERETILSAINLQQNILLNVEFKQPDMKSFDVIINETIERQTTQSDNLANLKQYAEDLEVCKFVLGEEGIKSFIIKRLLDMLNSSIQKYITLLGMTMRCRFDEYFDEQITNDRGKSISYWNFSGGERRTVDLACAWAFKDIKRKISGTSSNVEFLDEIFDSAFDERGLDLLIQVLKDRIEDNNLSCYAISHRKETLKHVDGEIVNIEKENGITTRIKD